MKGLEPIAVELSGGQFLPPVQTLVATLNFAPSEQNCISSPFRRTRNMAAQQSLSHAVRVTAPFTQGSLGRRKSP